MSADVPYYLARPDTTFADVATQAPPDLGAQIRAKTAEIETARTERERVAGEERAARERQTAELAPRFQAVEKAQAGVEAAKAARPEPVTLPAQPPHKISDFLAPVQGEQPENTISKLIQAIGIMATGFTGLARGDARSALSALKGAMQGWQEGDRERADRDFKAWQAQSHAIIKDWEIRHKTYQDIMADANLTMEQQLQLFNLKAVELGHDVAAKAAATKNHDAILQWLESDRADLRSLELKKLTLDQSAALRQQMLRMQEATREEARERWLLDYQQRERLAQQRIKEGHADKPLPGEWFDRKTGDRAYPTQEDFRSPDFAERFHKSNQQGVTRVEQIRIALPMIDRLRQLTTKILADQPVQNLVRALELEGQGKTASSPDLREWQALVKDTNVKMTSVMGPGQFRVTLLHVLQGAGLKTTDTKRTAARLLDQWETNIENDLAAITGQPLRAHLSGPWRGYATSPEGQRKVIELGEGERIDPGWKPLEEIK